MEPPSKPVYEFGPFRYDTAQRLLFRSAETVPLPPKAAETLEVLLDRRGRVVDKAELMTLVWPDTVVEEVGLARNISLLRKALGDEADSGAYIETVPKRGYRFVADVRIATPVGVQHMRRRRGYTWVAAGALLVLAILIYWQFYVPSRYLKAQGGASLAVVPFECLTSDLDRASFSQGLTELLVADLSKLDWLRVVAPSTVRRHQALRLSMGLMGRLLGLDVLVEGTAQKIGDGLRITARLVDVHTGKLIWAESYDYPGSDLGQIQTNAARTISAQVGAHLAIESKFSGR